MLASLGAIIGKIVAVAKTVGRAVLKVAPVVGKISALGFKAGAATKKATAALLATRLVRTAPAVVKTAVKLTPFIASEVAQRVADKSVKKLSPKAQFIVKPVVDIAVTGFQMGLI